MRHLAALAVAMGAFGEGQWNPEIERLKREKLAKDLAADPFHLIRKKFPKYEELDFRAEAELIREKKSKWPAADRETILRLVEAVEADEAAP